MDKDNSSSSAQRKLIVQIMLVFLAAFLIRGLILVTIGKDTRKLYTFDSIEYVTLAENLINHGIFSQEQSPPLLPDTMRTPGYPLFISAIFLMFGKNLSMIIVFQIVIGSITAVLAYYFSRKLGFTALAGLIAAWIIAVDPVSILLNNFVLTETLYTFELITGVGLLLIFFQNNDKRILVLSAIFISLSALTRPIGQFLPLALLLLFIAARKDKPLSATTVNGFIFLGICVLALSSWSYRNYRISDQFTLSTITNNNLVFYRARAVLATVENISQDEALEKLDTEIETLAAEQNLSEAEINSIGRKRAMEIFSQHPVETVVMLIKGAVRLLIDPGFSAICTTLDVSTFEYECFPGEGSMLEAGILDKVAGKFQVMTFVQQATLIWGTILLGIIYLGLAAGIIQLVSKKEWFALLVLLTLILYFVLLSAGGETHYRFRAPIQPFLAILSGVGYEAIQKYVARYKNMNKEIPPAG